MVKLNDTVTSQMDVQLINKDFAHLETMQELLFESNSIGSEQMTRINAYVRHKKCGAKGYRALGSVFTVTSSD